MFNRTTIGVWWSLLIFLAPSLLPLAEAVGSCQHRHVDMVFVQDASKSFGSLFPAMREKSEELAAQLLEIYDSISFALTTFVDKPIPFRGLGYGRGMAVDAENPDYCYRRYSPLSKNTSDFMSAFDALSKSPILSGGDSPENPYEALLYATQDPALLWSKKSEDIKFVVLITDDLPHYSGDGQLGINWWTGKGDQGGVVGEAPHFWDAEFIDSADFYPVDAPAIKPSNRSSSEYAELVALHDKLQSEEALGTDGEADRYNELYALYGPANYTDLEKHTGAFERYLDCQFLEYPDLATLGTVLNREKLIPLILLAAPEQVSTESELICTSRGYPLTSSGDIESFKQCALEIYQEDLRAMNVNLFKIDQFTNDPAEFVAAVRTIVKEISGDIDCQDTNSDETTTPPTNDDDCLYIDDSGKSSGKMAGVAIGCATAGAAISGLCVFLIYKKQLYMTRLISNASANSSLQPADIATVNLFTEREQAQALRAEDFV